MALIQEDDMTITLTPVAGFETLEDVKEEGLKLIEAIREQLFSITALWQVLAILASVLLGYLISRYPAKQLRKLAEDRDNTKFLYKLYNALSIVIWPVFIAILLFAATATYDALNMPNDGLRIVSNLLNAWIVVRVITSTMNDGFWPKALAVLAWTIAALYILRLIGPVSEALDSTKIGFAGIRISVLHIIQSVLIAGVALWIGRVAGDAAQSQLKGSKSLTPSMAGLLGQVVKITFMVVALVIALNSIGVNLAALTVFSGALGVGIGFGLQAIFSNFISGVIILFEKSVKVGDFIELQSGVTGLVREINIRSTLVTTNDNVDILVPNEEFIKAQVINWTLKETARRMRISFGVAYGSDKELVRKAGLEAAAAVDWTLDDGIRPAPQVWLVGFGDSSLDFQLVVWLRDDAVSRPAKVQADYNWALHTALEKYDLEIPFPQRDINFRNSSPVRVIIDSGDGTEG